MANLLTALDRDWAAFSSSAAGDAALRRWRHQTGMVFDDLAAPAGPKLPSPPMWWPPTMVRESPRLGALSDSLGPEL